MIEQDNHCSLTDSEFEKLFANCSLKPTLFNHEAHLRIAWIYIHNYGIEMAIEKISVDLESFINTVLASDKYDKRLTIAAMRTVHHYMRQSRSKNFGDFIQEFPELKFNFKKLVGLHYANDAFNSQHENSEFEYVDAEPIFILKN